jgi:NAD+ synthase (glutamine-hydrolysing)
MENDKQFGNYGFFRVASAIPELNVADCRFNLQQIKKLILEANEQKIQIVCFPELCITGYTCGDLFFQQNLIREAKEAIFTLVEETADLQVCFIVGAPLLLESKLYNCAFICHKGEIRGIVPKIYLPNYQEFYEKRWFESSPLGTNLSIEKSVHGPEEIGTNLLFNFGEFKFAVEICEDLWSVIPPSSHHALAGARMIFNLSASNELIGKRQYVKSLISQQSARCQAAYIYVAAGFGESSTDLVYSGNAYIYENGRLLAESKRFQMEQQLIVSEIDIDLLGEERQKNTTFSNQQAGFDYKLVNLSTRDEEDEAWRGDSFRMSRPVNPTPFIPASGDYNESCEEIFSIQVSGLAQRVRHTGVKSLVIGVSGGLDSTLALLVCAKTADKLGLSREMICGVTMPGFGTSERTYANAVRLIKSLGLTFREISIVAACEQHFKDIGHDPAIRNITYENVQARERTQILMDLANQLNGLVVGTGDMSELALGWTTYNGDQMSMYGVNAGIPKTLVQHLVRWVTNTQIDATSRSTLLDILDTPVSPELLPADSSGQIAQFTEEVIGPYRLHDFFLFYLLRYGFTPEKIYFLAKHAFKGEYNDSTILKWLEVFYRRFFSQQFKRSCMPDGPKVGSVNLSPRGDWRMPSDACANLWIEEIERLKNRT